MSTNQRILVMRHPETVGNVSHRLTGCDDVDLTERGEQQMKRAIKAVVAWKPDRVWCSPLSRCHAIAEEAAFELGLSCEVHPVFHELDFGPVHETTLDELAEKGYSFPWATDAEGHSIAPEGAESFEDIIARAHEALDELRPLEGRTAVISHGGFSRALIAAVLDAQVPLFWNCVLPNVSSQVFTCTDGVFKLAGVGLAPEEVMRRMEEPWLLGHDTVNDMNR